MDGIVTNGGVVEERQVPRIEVERPQRQCNQGVREEAEPMQEREHRPEDRPCETRKERQGREVAEQDVLEHVEAEELLAEGVQRAYERGEKQHDPAREESDPPAGYGRPAGAERPHPARVQDREQDGRHHLKRVESPAGVDGQMSQHGSSLPSCSSSITTW